MTPALEFSMQMEIRDIKLYGIVLLECHGDEVTVFVKSYL